jgi:hypothetical protein
MLVLVLHKHSVPEKRHGAYRVQHQHWYEGKYQQVSHWTTSRLENEARFTKKAVFVAFTLRAIGHGPCAQ